VLNPLSELPPPATLEVDGGGVPDPVTAPATPVPVVEAVELKVLEADVEREVEVEEVRVVVTSFGLVKLKYRELVVGDVSPSLKIWKKKTRPFLRSFPVPTFHMKSLMPFEFSILREECQLD
jgi:hypothetical protein